MSHEPTHSPLVIRELDLLFFIDETGHENFADTNHPVFGYGGCAVLGRDYHSQVVEPWRRMKAQYFGGASKPFHTKDITISRRRFSALSTFFLRPFPRFAAMTKRSTINSTRLGNYELTASSLMMRAQKIASWQPAERMVFIFESSQRLDPIADKAFPMVEFIEDVGGEKKSVPVEWFRMSKAAGESGLEIADFIIHTAGARVRQRERQATASRVSESFDMVFRSVNETLVSFFEVDSAAQP